MKRLLWFLLAASIMIFLPVRVSSAVIKNNDLTLASERISQDEKESLGEQSAKVRDLFKEEESQKLAESKKGKTALSSQQKELFHKGALITTSAKQQNTPLFQERVTHAVSLHADLEDDSWSWRNTLLYSAVILLTVVVAGFFTYRFNKDEEMDHAFH